MLYGTSSLVQHQVSPCAATVDSILLVVLFASATIYDFVRIWLNVHVEKIAFDWLAL